MYLLMVEHERQRYEAALERSGQIDASELKAISLDAAPVAIVDGIARIQVSGVLTQHPEPFLRYFGIDNTAYSDINAQLMQAEGNPDVKETVFEIGSGGGEVTGLFETLDAIAAATKPTRTIVGSMAASAAYGIASQTGSIEATSRASMLGSVGVATRAFVSDRVVDITSTEAPDKRPDASTEHGKATIRAELDQLHDLFADSIAAGRGISAEKVNSSFGRGAVMVAGKALEAGMIDSLRGHSASDNDNPSAAISSEEVKPMDLNELKTKHPSVFAEAKQEGVDAERDRAGAHLTMGEMGGMETAIAAVKDGTEMTQTLQAEYMKAAANKQSSNDRVDDNEAAAGADDGNTADENVDKTEALAEAIAGDMEKMAGGGDA